MGRLRVEMDELAARVSEQLERIAAQTDRIALLEAELSRDSNNSSKPPSSDPIGPRQSRAERRAEARAEKRRQGKQPGAPGAHLARRDPDAVVGHRPDRCRGCGADLLGADLVGEVRRQVIDLAKVAPVVTDHVAYRCRCSCGTETVAEFPPEAKAPTCWGPEVRALAVYLLDRQHLPVERTAELISDLSCSVRRCPPAGCVRCSSRPLTSCPASLPISKGAWPARQSCTRRRPAPGCGPPNIGCTQSAAGCSP